mgnify:FL=1
MEYPKSVNPLLTTPTEVPVPIAVYEKKSGNKGGEFLISDLRDSYHPLEIHTCGVYAIREFGSDPKKPGTLQVGQRAELWRYDYSGEKNADIVV